MGTIVKFPKVEQFNDLLDYRTEAFEWAEEQFEKSDSSEQYARLKNLDHRSDLMGWHLSLYTDGDRAILCNYNVIEQYGNYLYISNFEEAANKWPSEVEQLLRNGVYAYFLDKRPTLAEKINRCCS